MTPTQTKQIYVSTTMEAESEDLDPVKLVKPFSNSILTVPRRYFHCGTFYYLLFSVPLSNVYHLTLNVN